MKLQRKDNLNTIYLFLSSILNQLELPYQNVRTLRGLYLIKVQLLFSYHFNLISISILSVTFFVCHTNIIFPKVKIETFLFNLSNNISNDIQSYFPPIFYINYLSIIL